MLRWSKNLKLTRRNTFFQFLPSIDEVTNYIIWSFFKVARHSSALFDESI